VVSKTRFQPKPNGDENEGGTALLEEEAPPKRKARALKEEEVQAKLVDFTRLARGQGIALVTFIWRGITPLLMNKRGLIEPPSFMRSRVGDDVYAKWERAMKQDKGELDEQAYWDTEGQLCIPLLNCRKCTIEGAQDEKLPWNQSYNLKTIIAHAIRTDIAYFPLYRHLEVTPAGAVLRDRITTYEKHEIGGRNPGHWTHPGVNIVRPAVAPPWYLEGSFRVDLRAIKAYSEDPQPKHLRLLRDCMRSAGDAIGLGDWRQAPSGGPMGKFVLEALGVSKLLPSEQEKEDDGLLSSWTVL